MMDFLFFVKTFILTVAIVLVMQIQVGNNTLESHAMTWVQSSSVAAPLNSVARGAAKMFHDVTAKIWHGVHQNVEKKEKKEAKGFFPSFSWTRSSKTSSVQDEN